MREFSIHHKSAAVPSGFIPKGGDLVSAKFSDGSWYRAKIRRASPIKKEAEVTFIDYGNQDTVAFANIRPLDPRFRSLPGQAHDARLRCVFIISPLQRRFDRSLMWVMAVLSSCLALRANITQRQLSVSVRSARIESW